MRFVPANVPANVPAMCVDLEKRLETHVTSFALPVNTTVTVTYGNAYRRMDMQNKLYKGPSPALSDIIAGHVQMIFADPGSAVPLVRDGKVRALGVSSAS